MTYKEYREEDVLYIFELFMGHLKSKVLQGTVDSLDVAALTAVDVLVTYCKSMDKHCQNCVFNHEANMCELFSRIRPKTRKEML